MQLMQPVQFMPPMQLAYIYLQSLLVQNTIVYLKLYTVYHFIDVDRNEQIDEHEFTKVRTL